MSQGDEFKLQGGAAVNPEQEQEIEGGRNCDHTYNDMAVAQKSAAFLNFQGFEQPQVDPDVQAAICLKLSHDGQRHLNQVADWARRYCTLRHIPFIARLPHAVRVSAAYFFTAHESVLGAYVWTGRTL